jgi:serine/threonine protein kinase
MKGRVGTNGYMAPEIMTGKPYDAKCDVFSVAVVLFSMLAGFPPIQNQKEDGDAYWKKLSKSDFKGFWKWHERRFKFFYETERLKSQL